MIVISRKSIIAAAAGVILGMGMGSAIKQNPYVEVFTREQYEKTVIIDAGHGSPDGGAVGVSGVVEKDVNLAIAQKLREVLEGQGIAVIMTRDGDSGIQSEEANTIRKMKVSDMKKRQEIINKSNAELFLSIHMNSFTDKSASGLHLFYDKNHEEYKPLAEKIQNEMALVTGAQAHDVREAEDRLYLMKNTKVPSILVECGFLSNPDEEQKLIQEDYQSKIAWSIGTTVYEYFYGKE